MLREHRHDCELSSGDGNVMLRYASCFCEENVWWLCQEERFSGLQADVVFISNPHRCCALFAQKAASQPDAPVFWDYHVILCVDGIAGRDVWDLDCAAGTPLRACDWLQCTFAPAQKLPAVVQPTFRVVPADVYVSQFSSDRTHMRDEDGEVLMPFPSWPTILNGRPNLFQFVDMEKPFLGEVLDLVAISERWAA